MLPFLKLFSSGGTTFNYLFFFPSSSLSPQPRPFLPFFAPLGFFLPPPNFGRYESIKVRRGSDKYPQPRWYTLPPFIPLVFICSFFAGYDQNFMCFLVRSFFSFPFSSLICFSYSPTHRPTLRSPPLFFFPPPFLFFF